MYGSRAALDPWSNIVVAYVREEAIGGITMISVNQKKLSVPVLYHCQEACKSLLFGTGEM